MNNDKKEFDLGALLKVLKNNILLILVYIIGGVVVSYLIYTNTTPMYKSDALLYINPVISENSISDYNDVLAINRLAKNYSPMIKIKYNIDKVIDTKEYDISYSQVENNMNISIVPDTGLIKLSFLSDNAHKSEYVVDTIMNSFIEYLEQKFSVVNITVIQEASLNLNQASPVFIIILIFSLLISAIICFMHIMTIYFLDNKIKDVSTAEHVLKTNVIGVIADYSNIKIKSGLITLTDSKSYISEGYRLLRTNIDFKDVKKINITSTNGQEGKSELCANLAVSIASTNKRLLLIDLDLRKPRQQTLLKLKNEVGFTDYMLSDDVDFTKYITKYKNNNLEFDVLLSGSSVYNPAELLSSEKFTYFMQYVSSFYDIVLIDTPPTNLISDTKIISKLTDGTLYVVDSKNANKKEVLASLNSLRDSEDIKILGTVLTKTKIENKNNAYYE